METSEINVGNLIADIDRAGNKIQALTGMLFGMAEGVVLNDDEVEGVKEIVSDILSDLKQVKLDLIDARPFEFDPAE